MVSAVKITLTEEEMKQLEETIRSRKTEQRLVTRSKIVLLSSEGISSNRVNLGGVCSGPHEAFYLPQRAEHTRQSTSH